MLIFALKTSNMREEEYEGYEDQQLLNKWYNEASKIREEKDYVKLRSMPCGSKADQLMVPGSLGSRKRR